MISTCKDAEDIYSEVLARRVYELKEAQEGVDHICREMDEIYNEGAKLGEEHQTTPSGLRGRRGRYTLDSPPPSKHISYRPEMVGKQYGWVKIISPERRWNDKMDTCYVLTQCTGCGSILYWPKG